MATCEEMHVMLLCHSIIDNMESMPVKLNDKRSSLNHSVKLEIDIKLQPLHFQISRGVEWGIPTLVPQLLHLNDQFDVCLQHRRHVDVFEIHRPAGKFTMIA